MSTLPQHPEPSLEQKLAAILEGPSGPQIGAFFDFDGTLIDGYSAAAYFTDRIKRREVGLREIVDMVGLARKGDLSDDEFEVVIRDAVLDWAGKTEDEMVELWERLFRERITDHQFPEGWELVRAHKQMGHTVALASSATPYQLMPLAREWGVEHWLCTQPMVRNGRLTGGIKGKPAWGEGKAAAVREFAKSRKIKLADSYAYANGNEDIAFLKTVGHATAVNPKEHLATTAAAEGWPTMHFQPRKRVPRGDIARTAGAYGAMALSFLGGLGVARATGKPRRAVDMVTSVGMEVGFAVAGIELDVIGEQHLWSHRPAVFIINHQSKFDFFITMYLLRRNFTGVAKAEAANTPGFGKFMKMADMAFVDRGDSRKARETLEPVVQKIRDGLCLAIAPEGTRSHSPRVGKFKKGAFHIAMQAGVPVVPIVIRNAWEVMPRNAQAFRPGKIQIAVLPPVDVSGWTHETLDERIEQVRQTFVDTIEHWPESAI